MTDEGRPLARFSVVDLTTVRSGPTCTKILADFGAQVLRVERPGGEGRERVFYDAADLHRNKRSIAVNLQDGRGVGIVKRLAARADVVVENYRPDVYTVDQVFDDPQVKLAGLVREVANTAWGSHKVLGVPVRLSRTPAEVRSGAPMTGEHTRETLAGLGYDSTTGDTLREEGVIQEYRGGRA